MQVWKFSPDGNHRPTSQATDSDNDQDMESRQGMDQGSWVGMEARILLTTKSPGGSMRLGSAWLME